MPKINCNNCCGEFRWTNCSLQHSNAEEFVRSQWQSKTQNLNYLLYRWAIAIFYLSATITSIVCDTGYYLIYLTNWNMILCTVTQLYGAILLSVWYRRLEWSDKLKDSKMPKSFKCYWLLYNNALVIAITVTLIYWTLEYNPSKKITVISIITHVTNSVFMLIDISVVAHPIRLLHFIQPFAFGFTYVLFNAVYVTLGGINEYGDTFVYAILDWRRMPGKTTVIALSTLLIVIFNHLLVFLIYKIREAIYKCYIKNRSEETDDYCSTDDDPYSVHIKLPRVDDGFGKEII